MDYNIMRRNAFYTTGKKEIHSYKTIPNGSIFSPVGLNRLYYKINNNSMIDLTDDKICDIVFSEDFPLEMLKYSLYVKEIVKEE